jgi:uncharacterized membrane protein
MIGYPLSHAGSPGQSRSFAWPGCGWIPVVGLQIRMRDLARASEREGVPITPGYRACARLWFWLGIPAFVAVILVFWIMVAKPAV